MICRLFHEVHSDECEAMPHCSFDLRFSDSRRRRACFRVPLGLVTVSGLLGGFGATGHPVSG